MVPEAAVTVAVKETVWPVRRAFRAPMFQVTTPDEKVPPPVAETKVVPAGSVSVTTTSVRLDAPRLP
jgi:hypothetical protein